ncbi:MAG: hypothetical protein GC136_08275 [Alphaproteobacteria bacterium]|nr:hypothetical protein [Alphaproteobacteria bacterium]
MTNTKTKNEFTTNAGASPTAKLTSERLEDMMEYEEELMRSCHIRSHVSESSYSDSSYFLGSGFEVRKIIQGFTLGQQEGKDTLAETVEQVRKAVATMANDPKYKKYLLDDILQIGGSAELILLRQSLMQEYLPVCAQAAPEKFLTNIRLVGMMLEAGDIVQIDATNEINYKEIAQRAANTIRPHALQAARNIDSIAFGQILEQAFSRRSAFPKRVFAMLGLEIAKTFSEIRTENYAAMIAGVEPPAAPAPKLK